MIFLFSAVLPIAFRVQWQTASHCEAELTSGLPDEVEPDGLPNAQNIPTGTLQFNIFYHLGLAHYLKGDLAAALDAYRSPTT